MRVVLEGTNRVFYLPGSKFEASGLMCHLILLYSILIPLSIPKIFVSCIVDGVSGWLVVGGVQPFFYLFF